MTGPNLYKHFFFVLCLLFQQGTFFFLSPQGDLGEKGPEGAAGKDGARVRDFPE